MIDPQTGEEVTDGSPSRLSIALRRFWPLVLVTGIVAGVLTWVLTSMESPTYVATGHIVVVEPVNATNVTSDIQTVSALATSDEVLSQVADTTGLPFKKVQKDVTAVPETGAEVVDVTTHAPTAAGSVRMFQATYAAYRNIASLHSGPGSHTYAVTPHLPADASSPTPARDAAIAVVFGLLMAAGSGWISEIRRPTAADTRHAAAVLGAPMFAELPGRGAERRRRALTALSLDLDELAPKGTRILALGAARPSDTNTDFVVGLGRAFAAGGWRTVVVDGQTHVGRLTRQWAPPKATGLTDLVQGRGQVDAALVPMGAEGLSLLPLGRQEIDRGQTNLGERLGEVLDELTTHSDLVLVWLPGLGADAEARLLAARSDGLLLVVRGTTPISALLSLRERLELFRVTLIGFVRDDQSARWQRRPALRGRKRPKPVAAPVPAGSAYSGPVGKPPLVSLGGARAGERRLGNAATPPGDERTATQ